jgi:hypothetical protein
MNGIFATKKVLLRALIPHIDAVFLEVVGRSSLHAKGCNAD